MALDFIGFQGSVDYAECGVLKMRSVEDHSA